MIFSKAINLQSLRQTCLPWGQRLRYTAMVPPSISPSWSHLHPHPTTACSAQTCGSHPGKSSCQQLMPDGASRELGCLGSGRICLNLAMWPWKSLTLSRTLFCYHPMSYVPCLERLLWKLKEIIDILLWKWKFNSVEFSEWWLRASPCKMPLECCSMYGKARARACFPLQLVIFQGDRTHTHTHKAKMIIQEKYMSTKG